MPIMAHSVHPLPGMDTMTRAQGPMTTAAGREVTVTADFAVATGEAVGVEVVDEAFEPVELDAEEQERFLDRLFTQAESRMSEAA